MSCPAPLALGSIAIGHDAQLSSEQTTWIHAHLTQLTHSEEATLLMERIDQARAEVRYAHQLRVPAWSNCLRFQLDVRVPPGHYRLTLREHGDLAVGFLSVQEPADES